MDAAKAFLDAIGDPPATTDESPDPTGALVTTRARHNELEHAKRMPPGYKPASAAGLTFDPRLAFEIALRVDPPAEVFAKYGYDGDEAATLLQNVTFQQCVRAYAAEVEKDGLTFKTKARLQAEDLLAHAYAIAINTEVPASVRADLIKWHAKVAGLEPRGDDNAAQQGSGFQLQIVFGNTGAPDQPVTIQGERT